MKLSEQMKRRIKRFLETGKPQARVYLVNGCEGYYRISQPFPAFELKVPFKIDRLGRVYSS